MAADDEARQKELERKRLIEEIRRRAERAELERIEDEERKASDPTPTPSARAAVPPPVPKPAPPAEPPPPAPSPLELRIAEVKEKLGIALDRGLAEKAAPLLTALSALTPADPDLPDLEARLTALQQEQAARVKKKQAEAKPKEDAAQARARRDAQKRKIGELLEQANALYQQEKYEPALERIAGLLELEPGHTEALDLKEQVERARHLADELKEEEERRRAADAAAAKPAPVRKPAAPVAPGDPWGDAPVTTTAQTVYEDPEEKETVVQVKKPLADQVAGKLMSIRIPVKPLLTGAAVLVAAMLVYFIVDTVRTIVVPPKYSLLLFPATSDVTDGSQDYFTEGLTEELLGDLSTVPELRLIAPSSSLYFLDPRMHTAGTARSLSVNHFMTWNVRRLNDGIILALSLFDTVQSTPVWKSEFRTSLRELPSLRKEIARGILEAIGVELSGEQTARYRQAAPAIPEAQDVALRARYLLRHAAEGLLDSALTLFMLSRSLDSTDAGVHSGLAWTHVLAFERASDTAVAHIHTALRCVQSAIELDPSSAEGTRVWGIVNHYLGEQERALERLEEATRLAPADAESHRRLADLYLISGQSDDALLAAEAAFALDPFNVASYTVAGRVRDYRGQFGDDGQTEQMNEFQSAAQYYDGGARFAADRSTYLSEHNADVLVSLQQHDRAIEVLTDRVARARNSHIDYYRLGRTLQSAGKPIPRWQEVFRRSRELLAERLGAEPGNGVLWSWQALVHTRLGEAKEAAQATERAITLAPDNLEVLYNTARLYTIQREKEKALAYLKKAIDRRYVLTQVLDMDFFNLRQDPDFRTAITR